MHLAFPRPGWDLIGWIALAPVLWLGITARSWRQAFLEGWVGGWAFFVTLLRWLTHTMTTFSTLSGPLAGLVLLVLAGYLALYWGAVVAAVAWLARSLGPRAVWLAPPLWVTAELARSYALSGFPWGLLGYVPGPRLALIQIAAWTGVYGVSFLVVLVNAALAFGLARRTARAAGAALAVAGGAVALAWGVGAAVLAGPGLARPDGAAGSESGRTVPVAIVQGSIDQAVKWDPAHQRSTLGIYEELTRAGAPGSRLVVWPEAAVPAYVRYEPWVLGWLGALSAEVGAPLLVGAPDAVREGRTTRYLNSAFLVRDRGIQARYDKMHLVPFGEYVPLKGLLFFVEAIAAEIGDFTPGGEVVVFALDGVSFGTVICYEVIFPDLFRRFVALGADFMVNITNDAWFGESGGPLQHLAMVPLRAVENGVAVVRAANTGVSAVIEPSGRIGAALGLFRRDVLRVEVPTRTRRTFYTRYGDVFAYACGALSAGALLWGLYSRPERT